MLTNASLTELRAEMLIDMFHIKAISIQLWAKVLKHR